MTCLLHKALYKYELEIHVYFQLWFLYLSTCAFLLQENIDWINLFQQNKRHVSPKSDQDFKSTVAINVWSFFKGTVIWNYTFSSFKKQWVEVFQENIYPWLPD